MIYGCKKSSCNTLLHFSEARVAHQDPLDSLVPQANKVLKAREVCQELLVLQDREESLGPEENLDQQDPMANRELEVSLALQETQEHLEMQDLKDHKDRVVREVNQVNQAEMELQEHQASKVSLKWKQTFIWRFFAAY